MKRNVKGSSSGREERLRGREGAMEGQMEDLGINLQETGVRFIDLKPFGAEASFGLWPVVLICLLPLLSAQKSLSSVLLACHLLPWPLPFPGVLDMSSGLPASLFQERPPSSRCLLRRLTHIWKLALPLRWSLSVTFAFCWLPFSIFWVFNMSTYYFNNKNPHKNLW